MKARLRVLAVLCLVALTALAVAATAGARQATKAKHPSLQNTAYFIEWGIYGRNYTAKNVETSGQAAKLTNIDYAFANAAPDGAGHVTCQLADEWADYQKPWAASESVSGNEVTWPNPVLGNFEQLKELKALHPDLKVLISIGGWSFSKYFSDAALTPASRQAFVQSCVDLFIKGNLPDPGWGGMGGPGSAAGIFDGVDIDWEWPGSAGNDGNIIRAEDKANYVSLLNEFRTQLDAYGATQSKHYLLTAFLPANPNAIAAGIDKHVFDSLDYGDLQGYDLHGSWDSSTNFQSNLQVSKKGAPPFFSVEDVVQSYERLGAPDSKLVVGVPFYSYGWTGVPDVNHGLYQTATGPAPGVWAPGTNDYKAVAPLLSSGFTRYFDPSTKAAWIFDGTTFWTLDDPAILQAKAEFVNHRKLGGVMAWELSGDTADGSLETGLANGLWGS
jgi:chitinase